MLVFGSSEFFVDPQTRGAFKKTFESGQLPPPPTPNIMNTQSDSPPAPDGIKLLKGLLPGAKDGGGGSRGKRSGPVSFPETPAAQPLARCEESTPGAGRRAAIARPAPAHLPSRRRPSPGPRPAAPPEGCRAPAELSGARCLGDWSCRTPEATAARRGPGGVTAPSAAPERAEEGQRVEVPLLSREGPGLAVGSLKVGPEGWEREGNVKAEKGTARPGEGLVLRSLPVPQFLSLAPEMEAILGEMTEPQAESC
ncbi:unnamed protein product [Rangifer tarandus platyrhynchus]|uniref:Uncharacterized protein n=1 Tax=Rangifer tarandus platyrhynchus TaxID=3082113 RepID=A0ABN8XZB7_RANTA|nr:unnamed protein product [Rangifer tarandus platyrhynchus]